MVKKDMSPPAPASTVTTNAASSIPIIAFVLGVTSLATFTWFFGIPAIVLGIIGVRRYKENRGLSITGLVSGIISTILLIGFILFAVTMFAIALTSSDPDTILKNNPPQPYSAPHEREYDYPDWNSRQGI